MFSPEFYAKLPQSPSSSDVVTFHVKPLTEVQKLADKVEIVVNEDVPGAPKFKASSPPAGLNLSDLASESPVLRKSNITPRNAASNSNGKPFVLPQMAIVITPPSEQKVERSLFNNE